MSRSWIAVASIALGALAGSACTTHEVTPPEDRLGATENDLRLVSVKYLGKITAGQTKTARYRDPPHYRGYGFSASGGQTVDIKVTSDLGDAVAWITDASYNTVATNDDGSTESLDAHLVFHVPPGQGSRSYRVVYRDYDMREATFSVSLTIDAAVKSCTYGNETYSVGDHFDAADGCNTCTCDEDGVSCTSRACHCDPAQEPDRHYWGTPQQCVDLRVDCDAGWHPFYNPCGCGCELDGT